VAARDGGNVAIFDCFSGIAGDMTVAALVGAGASLEGISAQLRALAIPPFSLSIETVRRGGIEAGLLHVAIEREQTYGADEMRAKIEAAGFPARVTQRALGAVSALVAGESEAHRTSQPHLHEAGGVDALIDICGSMLALEALDVSQCFCPVVTVGGGAIARAEHGVIPASPGPAAAAILREHAFALRFTQSAHEMVTPTGAAILAVVAQPGGTTLRLSASGTGAGTFNPEERPNALRVFIGAAAGGGAHTVSELAANIDDMTPVMLSEVRDRLMSAGALDAWTEAIGMKKGRPAAKLCALVRTGEEERFAALFLGETTTLGVRFTSYERFEMTRVHRSFQSSLGPVAIKVSSYGAVTRVTPEFEDVRRISTERGLPVLAVQRIIEAELLGLRDE
jgi:uncharacterized protein (TIGR00299 family) protein